MASLLPIFVLSSIFLLFSGVVHSATFTITNNCGYTVWPGVLANAGTSPLSTTGFELKPGASSTLTAPGTWSGRFWARTLCSVDPSGKFACGTGDCGSGAMECSGGGAAPPATLAEFTLGNGAQQDFYDVSLVDGFNVPMLVSPQGGSGNCTATGCLVDLNGLCPAALRVASASSSDRLGVACKSACEAFGDPQYCCSGDYANPNTSLLQERVSSCLQLRLRRRNQHLYVQLRRLHHHPLPLHTQSEILQWAVPGCGWPTSDQ